MCSCSLRRGPVTALQRSGITEFIPESGLNAGATATLFKLVYCIGGNDRINQALAGINLPNGTPLTVGSQQDMDYLAAIHDKGDYSVFGGKNIKDILLAIEFTPEELKKSECTVGISTDN